MNASPSSEIAADAPSVVEALPVAPASRGRRLVEWFWRGRALAEAKSRDDSNANPAFLKMAEEVTEVADRLSAGIDPPRAGSGFGSAILLYREALRAAVLSVGDADDPAAPGDAALERLLSESGAEAVVSARKLLSRDASAVGRLAERERREEAAAARGLLHSAIGVLIAERQGRRRALSQRLLRMTLLAVLLSAILVGAAVLVVRLTRHPNFLEHAVLRTSSTYSGFSLSDGVCDGRKTRIIFHTNREDQPYAEFDMGTPKVIRNIELVNRGDCCEDRALPLAVEISLDGKVWREVMRRTEPFSELRQKLPPTSVRIVRVRALKKTWFHLERVAAW